MAPSFSNLAFIRAYIAETLFSGWKKTWQAFSFSRALRATTVLTPVALPVVAPVVAPIVATIATTTTAEAARGGGGGGFHGGGNAFHGGGGGYRGGLSNGNISLPPGTYNFGPYNKVVSVARPRTVPTVAAIPTPGRAPVYDHAGHMRIRSNVNYGYGYDSYGYGAPLFHIGFRLPSFFGPPVDVAYAGTESPYAAPGYGRPTSSGTNFDAAQLLKKIRQERANDLKRQETVFKKTLDDALKPVVKDVSDLKTDVGKLKSEVDAIKASNPDNDTSWQGLAKKWGPWALGLLGAVLGAGAFIFSILNRRRTNAALQGLQDDNNGLRQEIQRLATPPEPLPQDPATPPAPDNQPRLIGSPDLNEGTQEYPAREPAPQPVVETPAPAPDAVPPAPAAQPVAETQASTAEAPATARTGRNSSRAFAIGGDIGEPRVAAPEAATPAAPAISPEIQALIQVQQEQTRAMQEGFRQVAEEIGKIHAEVVKTNQKLDETNAKLDALSARVDNIEAGLAQTNEKVDALRNDMAQMVKDEVAKALAAAMPAVTSPAPVAAVTTAEAVAAPAANNNLSGQPFFGSNNNFSGATINVNMQSGTQTVGAAPARPVTLTVAMARPASAPQA